MVNYDEAYSLKNTLLKKAYGNFMQAGMDHTAFERFCAEEQAWLDDFALYQTIKEENNGLPWYEWDDTLKLRDKSFLRHFAEAHKDGLQFIRWAQFIFFRQWRTLHEYCHRRGIRLIGDIAFYASYDSADVWSHRELFSLDEAGHRITVAGVPPDAFSSDGQVWGMPVYDWQKMAEDKYEWWVHRVSHHLKFYDILRLDHFRAFSSYWAVPACDQTAIGGQWLPGPGRDLFREIERRCGSLPFIAEDLGEIDDAVYELRDAFHLRGMEILQFAFGDDFPRSLYIPHRHVHSAVVYPGTHDNDTTRGWWTAADDSLRAHLREYFAAEVTGETIADTLCRAAYASVSDIAILPMQDILGLDSSARMNVPAHGGNNWQWRLLPHQLSDEVAGKLSDWCRIYGR